MRRCEGERVRIWVNNIPNLHDAVLVGFTAKWSEESTTLTIEIDLFDVEETLFLTLESVSRCVFDRSNLWGPSDSIEELTFVGDSSGTMVFRFQMQSGDVIHVEGRSYTARTEASLVDSE
jgi:hypothetical protein